MRDPLGRQAQTSKWIPALRAFAAQLGRDDRRRWVALPSRLVLG